MKSQKNINEMAEKKFLTALNEVKAGNGRRCGTIGKWPDKIRSEVVKTPNYYLLVTDGTPVACVGLVSSMSGAQIPWNMVDMHNRVSRRNLQPNIIKRHISIFFEQYGPAVDNSLTWERLAKTGEEIA